MKKTIIVSAVIIILACVFTGCESNTANKEDESTVTVIDAADIIAADTTIKPEDVGTEDNYFGTFANEDYTLSIEADESGMMNFTIKSAIKDNKADQWSFKGYYSTESNIVNYSNAVRSEISYDKNGSEKSNTTVYEDGAGRIIFTDTDHIVWKSSSDRLDGNNEFVREK